MGRTFRNYFDRYSDSLDDDQNIEQTVDSMHALAYQRQIEREARLWEKRRSGPANPTS